MTFPNLLSTNRFLPLFLTQFLGALNDNLLKNALVMLVTYRIATAQGESAQILVTLAAGLFILPYFLFSATAGQLADKYDRAKITRIIKLVEIIIMVFAAIGFHAQNVNFLLFTLFCMGVHSTFFGPIKYALLPQHLYENELLAGNAYIESGTFLAILLGTIIGGLLILQENGVPLLSAALIGIAILGYGASRYIPPTSAPEPGLRINYNLWQETWKIIGHSRSDRKVFLCILGISWFWLIGATFLSQFPTYAKDILHADETVVTLFLTVFSIGIGIGSMLCNKLLKGHIESTYVPLATVGISLFTIDLHFASQSTPSATNALLTAWEFLTSGAGSRIAIDLLLISICAGIYIVPLYAIMQHRSEVIHRARIIAANNVINALFMVVSAIGTLLMLKLSLSIPQVFLTIAILNGFVMIYICKLLPDALLRSLIRAILKLAYRVEIRGLEHYSAAGERVLIIANHTSFLDAAIIAAFLPEKITFAINTHIARKWWIKPWLVLVDAFPLDPTNPLATKSLIDVLKKDRKCMIFPEGRITITGTLMKIYEGSGMIADKSGAKLLPVRIDGAQYTIFSRLKGKVRIHWFQKITLTILPPCVFSVPGIIKGRKRRQMAGMQLYDIMSQMIFDSSNYRQSLFSSLLCARSIHGSRHIIAEDIERKQLNYRQFIRRSFVLGKILHRLYPEQQSLGIMLPTSVATALTIFGLHAFGRIPAMINFTAGSAQIISACRSAKITTILTSQRFISAGKMDNLIKELSAAGIVVDYLELLRAHLSFGDRIFGLSASFMPKRLYKRTGRGITPDSPAFILFTSGSEGTPKGVVLSHANIQANCYQLASRIDFGPQDKVFNCLPMFHAFGLTGGTLLPLLSGIQTFYYPSPLHYRIVPELIYDTNATILFGTDTFLSAYGRCAHAYDLHFIRYIFAGAEKLKEETRKTYAEKFGIRIFEGYGATETAPVLSTNTPMQNRENTVGRFMPGISWKLEPIPGIEEGGQLWVKGPNIMLGYLHPDTPGMLQSPIDGWYDTGDIVTIDDHGYVAIKGRTKRFAKIGGEMVSLSAVEIAVESLWPACRHAAITVPDQRKGEQIILLTDHKGATHNDLIMHFRTLKISELSLPKRVQILDVMPLLVTGKIDYREATQLILQNQVQL